MDVISYNEAATANSRIESFIENPDSKSGLVSLPKKISVGESVTIPDGRVVVHPNLEIDGTLTIEDGGELFVPFGGTLVSSDLVHPVDTIADLRNATGKYKYVYVTGYHTKNDGAFGSNMFIWDENSTETDNGGTIIKCTTIATGRYKLRYTGAVNVKWFGAKGDGITDDTLAIQNAVNANEILNFNTAKTYLLSSQLLLKNYSRLYGNGCTIIATNTNTFPSDNFIDGANKIDIVIRDFVFIGQGNDSNLITYLSLSEAVNPMIEGCLFKDIHGLCIRLNKTTNVVCKDLRFKDITGEDTSPGNCIYANGLLYGTFDNIYAENLGDHCFYLQGDDTTDFYSINGIKINNIYVKNSGQNGLTAGSAIAIYNRATDIIISNAIFDACRSGIKISTKVGYTATPHERISISNVIVNNPINLGVDVSMDDVPDANFKDISISNFTVKNSNNVGLRFYNVKGLKLNNVTANECTDGLQLYSCSDFVISGCDFSLSYLSTGLLVSECSNGVILGVKASQCYRAGLNIQGYCDRITVNSVQLLPTNHPTTGGVNDTFIMSSTATNCVVNGVVPRDKGNVVSTIMHGTATPSEGYYTKGDIVFNTGATSGNYIGWVCTTSGAPGTWKTFGAISA